MKIIINPEFEQYMAFVKAIPQLFHKEGKTIFKARNELKVFEQDGVEFVVKSFKVPHFINQVVYAVLRPSKAERSYKYARTLIDKGISTPTPVAYIEIKKYGLFFNSFFISIKSRFHREIREISNDPDLPEAHEVLSGFARFTADLHQKGIFHKDYTPGNILFGKTGDRYDFELVDLNRMKFGPVAMDKGCRNLYNLYFPKHQFVCIARQYAQQRGFDPDQCEKLVLKYAKNRMQR